MRHQRPPAPWSLLRHTHTSRSTAPPTTTPATAYPGAEDVVALEDEVEMASPDKPPEGGPEPPPEEEAPRKPPPEDVEVPLPSEQEAEVVYSGACQLVSIKRVLVGRCVSGHAVHAEPHVHCKQHRTCMR